MSSSQLHPEEPGSTGRARTRPWDPSINFHDTVIVSNRRRRNTDNKINRSNNNNKGSSNEDDNIVDRSSEKEEKVINTGKTTCNWPPLTRDSSMEALNASRYIVSVVFVLLLGGLVGILATVSHHLRHHRLDQLNSDIFSADYLSNYLHKDHRNYYLIRNYQLRFHHYHHYYYHRQRFQHREGIAVSQQLRVFIGDHQNYSSTPMLTVSTGMEVGSGGHRSGLSGSLEAKSPTDDNMHQEAMVAVARDRAIRASSVRHDLALDLPPRLQLPDGEEKPYGAQAGLHLRDPDQESEIYQKCVRPPPNRTIFDSESPPPYRSQSGLLDTQERIVRCHSAGSSLLRVFRKFPSSMNNSNSTPTVVVPSVRRPILSSCTESSVTDVNGGNAKAAHHDSNLEDIEPSELQIDSKDPEILKNRDKMYEDGINGDDKCVVKQMDIVKRKMRKSKSNSTSSVENDAKPRLKGSKRKLSEPDSPNSDECAEFMGFTPSSIMIIEAGVQILQKLISEAELEEAGTVKRKRVPSIKASAPDSESKTLAERLESPKDADDVDDKVTAVSKEFKSKKNGKDQETTAIDTITNMADADYDESLTVQSIENDEKDNSPDEMYREPFKYGWKREMIYKGGLDSNLKRSADIYYYSPKGKRVKNLREVAECLTTKDLVLDNFTFSKEPIGMNDPALEIIRDAKRLRSDSTGTPTITSKRSLSKRSLVKNSVTPPPVPKAEMKTSPYKSTPKIKVQVKVPGKRGSQKKEVRPAKEPEMLPPQWNSLNVTRRSQGPAEKVTSPKSKRMLKAKLQEPCSIRCPMSMGLIPSLQCCICLCLYHPECVGGKNNSVSKEYICKNCQMELEPSAHPTSSITPPPLIPISMIGSHGIKLNTIPSDGASKLQHSKLENDKLLKEKPKANSTGVPSMLAKMDSSWLVPPVNEFLQSHDGSVPKPAQNIANMGGKRYIVVPKNNDMAVQPAIPIKPDKMNEQKIAGENPPTYTIPEKSTFDTQKTCPIQDRQINQDKNESRSEEIRMRNGKIIESLNSARESIPPVVDTKSDESEPAIRTMEVHMDVESVELDKPVELESPDESHISDKDTAPIDKEDEIRSIHEKTVDTPVILQNDEKKNRESPKKKSKHDNSTKKKPVPVEVPEKQHFMVSVCAGYDALSRIFQYLKVQELLRAARVCRMWRDLAAHPALWKTVRMKNSQVTDWDGLAASLKRHGTEHLDLRKMLVAGESDSIWEKFVAVIPSVPSLIKLELCRCPASVVEDILKCCPQLEVLSAMSIKCDSVNLESIGNLKSLTELRLKSISGMSIQKDLSPLAELTQLTHLSLTSVKELGKKKIDVINNLIKLETLELGECSDFPEKFGTEVLLKLINLERLRLEKGQGSCCTFDILDGISKLEKLHQLELVNFDVKNGFDKYLANCKNIKRLLIIPTYISQSATSNNMVLGGVTELSDNLTHFVWGVTLELLRVTELFVDQCNQMNKPVSGDSIPVLKPVPCLRLIEPNDEATDTVPDEKQSNLTNPQVDILPLPQLQKLLLTALPKTRVKILKIPFHATWRQSISDTTSQ